MMWYGASAAQREIYTFIVSKKVSKISEIVQCL